MAVIVGIFTEREQHLFGHCPHRNSRRHHDLSGQMAEFMAGHLWGNAISCKP